MDAQASEQRMLWRDSADAQTSEQRRLSSTQTRSSEPCLLTFAISTILHWPAQILACVSVVCQSLFVTNPQSVSICDGLEWRNILMKGI